MTCQPLPSQRCDNTIQPITRWFTSPHGGWVAGFEEQVRSQLPRSPRNPPQICRQFVGKYRHPEYRRWKSPIVADS